MSDLNPSKTQTFSSEWCQWGVNPLNRKPDGISGFSMERRTRFELATFCLEGKVQLSAASQVSHNVELECRLKAELRVHGGAGVSERP